MGFFDLKVQCAVCDKTIGLNRNQLSKDVWICPSCKKAILKKHKYYSFADLQKMDIDKLKELAGVNPKRFTDDEIKDILNFCTENQNEFLQQFNDE